MATMRGQPDPGGYTAPYVEDRLEQAGRTLLALPWAGCFPAGMTCLWPEISGSEPRRYAVPATPAITAMDQAYRWISLISDPDPGQLVLMRSLVLRRSLVIPDSPEDHPRYRFRWRDLQRTTGLHRDTLKARWGRGIDLIVAGLNRPARPAAKPGGRCSCRDNTGNADFQMSRSVSVPCAQFRASSGGRTTVSSGPFRMSQR